MGGAPRDEGGSYLLATNDFMAGGGDGDAMFAGNPPVIDPNAAELMAAQVIRAFEDGTAVPVLDGRITIVE